MTHKKCKKCEVVKPVSEFYKKDPKSQYESQHYTPRCKACERPERRIERPEPVGHRKRKENLRARGLSLCAICNETKPVIEFHIRTDDGKPHSYCRACDSKGACEQRRNRAAIPKPIVPLSTNFNSPLPMGKQ